MSSGMLWHLDMLKKRRQEINPLEMMAAGDEAQGDPLRVGCGGQINQLDS